MRQLTAEQFKCELRKRCMLQSIPLNQFDHLCESVHCHQLDAKLSDDESLMLFEQCAELEVVAHSRTWGFIKLGKDESDRTPTESRTSSPSFTHLFPDLMDPREALVMHLIETIGRKVDPERITSTKGGVSYSRTFPHPALTYIRICHAYFTLRLTDKEWKEHWRNAGWANRYRWFKVKV